LSSYLSVNPIQTSIFHPGDDLVEFILQNASMHLKENSILAITSKIFSIAENRIIPRDSISKIDLIKKDCDYFVCETSHGVCLTIKHGLLIPSSGIDESNSESGDYLLFPENPFQSLEILHEKLQSKLNIRSFGLIMTDSHSHALRKGVTGIALAHWGFKATRNLVGAEDLFGRKLKMTMVNVVDSLAVSAVLTMGEAAEACPLAILQCNHIEFTDRTDPSEIRIPLEEDLYGPLLKR